MMITEPSSTAFSSIDKSGIAIRKLSLVRGQGSRPKFLFRNFEVNFNPGELAAVLGVSGCGKTTLLKVISGDLPPPKNAVVEIDGVAPPQARTQKLLFNLPQGFKPPFWLNARESIMLPLTLAQFNLSGDDREIRVEEILSRFDISAFSDRRPQELSGGQVRRVGLAMAFVSRPKYLLLDEPFTGLDSIARIELYRYLLDYVDKTQIEQNCLSSCIVVTHDVAEAALIADRIYIFRDTPLTGLESFPNPLSRKERLQGLRALQYSDKIQPFMKQILSRLPDRSSA